MLARLWPRFLHRDGARLAAHCPNGRTADAAAKLKQGPSYLRDAPGPPRLTRFCPIQPGFLPILNAAPSPARHVAFRAGNGARRRSRPARDGDDPTRAYGLFRIPRVCRKQGRGIFYTGRRSEPLVARPHGCCDAVRPVKRQHGGDPLLLTRLPISAEFFRKCDCSDLTRAAKQRMPH